MIKKVLLAAAAILVVIQFIHPKHNTSTGPFPNDITTAFTVPDNVQQILGKACNDCHSNNTTYPWYSRIQPVDWWLQDHVNDGKEELNFSEFAAYKPKRQHHKMKEVIEQVKEGEMPLNSYTWVHKEALLTDEEKVILTTWAEQLRAEIAVKNNLPAEPERERRE